MRGQKVCRTNLVSGKTWFWSDWLESESLPESESEPESEQLDLAAAAEVAEAAAPGCVAPVWPRGLSDLLLALLMTVDWLLLLPSLAAGILVLDKSLSESSDNLGFKCRAENTIGNTYRKVAGPEFGKKTPWILRLQMKKWLRVTILWPWR